MLRHTYYRTVSAIRQLADQFQNAPSEYRILEIGSFTGIVSRALASSGFQVTASDIPFVFEDSQLVDFYARHGIKTIPHDLSSREFPASNETYHAIVFCEVLEHLNINPIPLLKEFRRILKPGGHVYCATPNLASAKNRLQLLRGKGFYNPIEHLAWNLVPNSGMSVGLHWREYTKQELCELFQRSGFELIRHDYFNYADSASQNKFFRKTLVRLMYLLAPSLKHGQCAIFQASP